MKILNFTHLVTVKISTSECFFVGIINEPFPIENLGNFKQEIFVGNFNKKIGMKN